MMLKKKQALVMSVLCAIASVGFVISASAEEPENYKLDEIVVEGERDIAGGYLSRDIKLGMMPASDIMNLPYSSISINNTAIKDFAIGGNNEMMDILAFSPSVRKTTSPDLVAMRGKQVSAQQMNINGINGLYSNFSTGMNFIEKIDVVSGPALLYTGSNTQNVIGGVIGLQSKQAKEKPNTDIGLKYIGKGSLEENVDIGRRFGKNNDWGVRINALNKNGELAVHDEKLEQRNIYINIDHKGSNNKSNLLAGYAYSKHNGGNTIFPTSATMPFLPDAPDGSHNLNPKWAIKESKTWLFALNHDQKINKNWSAFINAGLMKNEVPVNISGSAMGAGIFQFDANGNFDGTFSRTLTASASATSRRYIGAGIKSEYDFNFMKNDFLVGVDKAFAKSWTAASSQSLGSFSGNIYGDNNWDRPNIRSISVRPNARYTTAGWTVIDTMKFFDDKLLVSGGLHYHEYKAESISSSGTVSSNPAYDATCPTYGVVYKFTPDLMVYANHSETFLAGTQVPSGYANEGDLLDPAKTKSNEIGIKVKTGNMLNTLAFYKSKEPGYMVDDNNYYGPIGETLYKGIEFSTAGSISPKWDLMASIGFCRYIWEKNNDPSLNGLTANGIPKWNGNLAVVYKPDDKFSVLGRMSYIGESKIHYSQYEVPSFVRFDLGVKYKTKMNNVPVTLSAMCYNLTNEKNWFTADQGNQLLFGDPRTFVLSADFAI